MKKVIFYFDGFNFYNGLKERAEINSDRKNYYWIDLVKFCSCFIYEGSELKNVKYFTAPPDSKEKLSKQSALFSAIKLLNPGKFEVINGHYLRKTILCRADCRQKFQTLEEKRTDVNIAVSMIMDCVNDEVDTLVLISADTDQIPTIEAIQKHFPTKTLKVYFPPKRNSSDILAKCKPVVFLDNHEDKFKKSIMPGEVTSESSDKKYTRPKDWKK